VNFRKLLRAFSTPVTLLILFALLLAGVYWGYKTVTGKVTAPPTPCVTTAMSELTPDKVTVNVYNGGDKNGLATRVSQVLTKGGFAIGKVGNTDEKVATIIILGADPESPEVKLVASWFAEPGIQADNRSDHSVDVLLGNAYDEVKGLAAHPLTEIPIPGGVVCLPSPPTQASATPSGGTTGPSSKPT